MDDRRVDDKSRDRIEQLSITVERLVVISENQSKSIDGLEVWVKKHDEQYHHLDKRMDETTLIVSSWSTQINDVKDQIKSLVSSLNKITEVGLKVKGGWITVILLASTLMGLVSLAKAFGII